MKVVCMDVFVFIMYILEINSSISQILNKFVQHISLHKKRDNCIFLLLRSYAAGSKN